MTAPRMRTNYIDHGALEAMVDTRFGLPDTDLQALMEAAPHDEPIESREAREAREGEREVENQRLYDALHEALTEGSLSAAARHILIRHVMQGLPLRRVASELGLSKTTVARQRDAALQVLRTILGGTE